MKKLLLVLLTLGLALPVQGYITSRRLVGGAVLQNRWPSSTSTTMITLSLNPTQGARVTGDRTLLAVAQSSVNAWDVSFTNFDFVRGADTAADLSFGNDGVNMIKTNLTTAQYANSGAGDALAITYMTTAATTGQILDADIIFNPDLDFTLSTTVAANRYDFESVLTHEIGHLLGLDHSAMINASMYPRISTGISTPRVISDDDKAGVRAIYPTTAMGSISGTVRLTSNAVVYGAVVVALTSSGQAVAHGVTDTRGNFVINGLEPGSYRLYAEPMDAPYAFADQGTLGEINGSSAISTGFTSRFR
jgi:hypothetical protein